MFFTLKQQSQMFATVKIDQKKIRVCKKEKGIDARELSHFYTQNGTTPSELR
jgi:hypothetical protein